MYTRRRRVLGLFGASILALSALTIGAPAALASAVRGMPGQGMAGHSAALTVLNTANARAEKDGSGPMLNLTKPSDCSKFQAPSQTPYVEFCKPVFDGNINGPYGSHVTLALGGFSSGGLQFKDVFLTSDTSKTKNGCDSHSGTCLTFATPPSLKGEGDPAFLQFDWTFDPSVAKPGSDFNAVVEYTKSNGKAAVQQQPSQTTFTLTSPQPPCLVVSTDQITAPDPSKPCTSSSQVYVLPGGSLWITGVGWVALDSSQNPYDQTIDLWACKPSDQVCASTPNNSVFPVQHVDLPDQNQTTSGQTNGDFQVKVSLPSGAPGTVQKIQVMASNSLKSIDKANNADGSLTFGMGGEPSSGTFNLSPFPCLWTGTGANCSGANPGVVSSGSLVAVNGADWYPGGTVTVTEQLKPCSGSSANPTTTHPTATATPTGSSHGDIVPSGAPGQVDAAGHESQASGYPALMQATGGSGGGTLPQNQPSKVNDSGVMQPVTFTVPRNLSKNATIYLCASEQGHANWTVPSAGSNSALSLKVKPAAAASSLQKLLLALGVLFTLVGGGVFVLTMPKRAAVPQPVGRR